MTKNVKINVNTKDLSISSKYFKDKFFILNDHVNNKLQTSFAFLCINLTIFLSFIYL